MKRREMIAAMAGIAASGQAASSPAAGTLYIPEAHRVEDLALLHDTMERYPFVDLVTSVPSLRITHIPVWIDRTAGPYGAILGHVSKNNPQAEALNGQNTAVVVFHGPDAYISPSWYENTRAVPTWNFATVHASGKPQPVTDEQPFRELLATLIARSEKRYGGSNYDFNALPRSYVSGLMQGIVGFRMTIDLLEGKFKLGQERSEKDRASLVSHLRGAAPGPSMADFTGDFFERYRKRKPAGKE